ncbi:MAG: protein translocase subunit SecD, partial [Bacteroidales bacterium]|nr:protein translocase subunit SecD [Bacteroidales bacterium]
GLDLKGGMNVTLSVSVVDIVRALSGYSTDPTFNKAIDMALEKQRTSNRNFVTLFAESFSEIDPQARLAAIFTTIELKDRVTPKSTNEEVLEVIRQETDDAFDRTLNILRTRIDRFGVAQPNIQPLEQSGRILVELPGIKEPERVRKLLQGTANLEFWETYDFGEIQSYFSDANEKLVSLVRRQSEVQDTALVQDSVPFNAEEPLLTDEAELNPDTLAADTGLLGKLSDTSAAGAADQTREEWSKENPLFSVLTPAYYQNEQGQYFAGQGPIVGFAAIKDTGTVNHYIKLARTIFPRDLKLAWIVKPAKDQPDVLQLIALKVTSRDGQPPLDGNAIVDARQDYNPNGQVEISMTMNSEGARVWKRLTGENIGKSVAIVLDNYVYSFPTVNDEIPNGRSSITGNFSVEEAKDLANILKAGKLPAPARIIQEEVVGPSLGQESITQGLRSFLLAFLLVLVYMVFYYNRAGLVADLALVINIFFIFGVLASLGAVLTLPGIAGIVLTLGMAVDANVIIYERILDETRAGKGLRLAITDGYKNAYSAIIDGNVTTLLTGIVLYTFGTGPIQGFATTLIIGILSSLFTAIFISRLIFNWMMEKNKKLQFDNDITRNAFQNLHFDFIGKRKMAYIISGSIIFLGLISLGVRGLNFGIDFTGGRTYV